MSVIRRKLLGITIFLLVLLLVVGCSGEKKDLEQVTLSVERTGGLLTSIGKVKVYVDDDEVMKVKNNEIESIDLSLSPGTHTIQTKGQGDKSDVLKFKVEAGAPNNFQFHTEISNIYGVKLEKINRVATANQTKQVEKQAEETEETSDEETSDAVQDDQEASESDPASVNGDVSSDYILPDSDTRMLEESEISGLNSMQIRIARNEIYARHGYIFTSEDLQQYFSEKTWYEADSTYDGKLSETEAYNLDLIKSVEGN